MFFILYTKDERISFTQEKLKLGVEPSVHNLDNWHELYKSPFHHIPPC